MASARFSFTPVYLRHPFSSPHGFLAASSSLSRTGMDKPQPPSPTSPTSTYLPFIYPIYPSCFIITSPCSTMASRQASTSPGAPKHTVRFASTSSTST